METKLKWYTLENQGAESGIDVYCEGCASDLIDHGIMMEVNPKNLSPQKKCTSCEKPYEP